MSKSPAFQFYAAEFLSDENVVLMTNQEVGCYIKLMAYCWREGSIPAEIPKIAKLCGEDSSAMAQLWLAIGSCFIVASDNPERLVHPRLEKERMKQKEHAEERSASGKKGAKAKWDKALKAIQSTESIDGSAISSAIKEPMAKDGSSSSSSTSLLKEDMDSACAQGEPLPDPTPYGEMAKLLRANGVQDIHPGNPVLRAWVEKGLTAEEAWAGLEVARAARGSPSPMTWPYLARVLETQREKAAATIPEKGANPAPKANADQWWRSDSGIDRKGRELGMFARGGESYSAFKDRIFDELRRREGESEGVA